MRRDESKEEIENELNNDNDESTKNATKKIQIDDDLSKKSSDIASALISDAVSLLVLVYYIACFSFSLVFGVGFYWKCMLIAEFALVPLFCAWFYVLAVAESKSNDFAKYCKENELNLNENSSFYARNGGLAVFVLKSKLLQSLGDISYSVYVIHYPIIHLFTWLANNSLVELKIRDRKVYMGTDTTVEGPFALDSYQILSILSLVIVLGGVCSSLIETPLRGGIVGMFEQRRKRRNVMLQDKL